MVFPMFPESERTRTDSPNVFIHKPPHPGCGYRVWFVVGVQYFRIGDLDHDDLEHAQWHARMFIKALGKFKAGKGEEPDDDAEGVQEAHPGGHAGPALADGPQDRA